MTVCSSEKMSACAKIILQRSVYRATLHSYITAQETLYWFISDPLSYEVIPLQVGQRRTDTKGRYPAHVLKVPLTKMNQSDSNTAYNALVVVLLFRFKIVEGDDVPFAVCTRLSSRSLSLSKSVVGFNTIHARLVKGGRLCRQSYYLKSEKYGLMQSTRVSNRVGRYGSSGGGIELSVDDLTAEERLSEKLLRGCDFERMAWMERREGSQ